MPTAAIQRGAPGHLRLSRQGRQHRRHRAGRDRRRPTARQIAVTKGLEPGEQVVIDGADRLRDGAKVRRPTAPGTSASAAPARGAGRAAAATRRRRRRQSAGNAAGAAQRGRAASVRGRRGERRSGATPAARQDQPVVPPRHEPVAALHPAAGGTSLLMAAIMLVGMVAFQLPAAVGAARGRLPDHPGADALSRRQPGGDDLVGHRAARAPVRPDAGPQPDVVDQLGRRLGRSRCSSTSTSRLDVAEQEVQAAINAAGNLLPADLPAPPIYAKVNPADAPILTLARHLEDRCR